MPKRILPERTDLIQADFDQASAFARASSEQKMSLDELAAVQNAVGENDNVAGMKTDLRVLETLGFSLMEDPAKSDEFGAVERACDSLRAAIAKAESPTRWQVLEPTTIVLAQSGPSRFERGELVSDPTILDAFRRSGVALRPVA